MLLSWPGLVVVRGCPQTEKINLAGLQIRFEDGAGYERMMGTWSRLTGDIFLDWLVPRSGLRWIDVGCGNGAFTELLAERCSPAEIQGIDPSDAQLAFCAGSALGTHRKVSKGGRDGASFCGERF